jgi:hypothetical protein
MAVQDKAWYCINAICHMHNVVCVLCCAVLCGVMYLERDGALPLLVTTIAFLLRTNILRAVVKGRKNRKRNKKGNKEKGSNDTKKNQSRGVQLSKFVYNHRQKRFL